MQRYCLAAWLIICLALKLAPITATAATTVKQAKPPLGATVSTRTKVANDESLLEKRKLYLHALDQIRARDWQSYNTTYQKLDNYPLKPYLEYHRHRALIKSLSPTQANAFIKRYRDIYLASSFKGMWLYELMARGDWREFLKVYDKRNNTALACYALRAKIREGKTNNQQLVEKAKSFWLVGKNQPKSCDPVFAWLKDKKILNDSLRWQRARLLIKKNQWRLAAVIAKPLGGSYAKMYQDWVYLRQNPQRILEKRFAQDSAHHRELAVYAVNRSLVSSVDKALKLWQKVAAKYSFNHQSKRMLLPKIAVRSAQRHEAQALLLLNALPNSYLTEAARHWRVRSAIRAEDYKAVLSGFSSLTADEKKQDKWQYWQARALMELGHKAQAEAIYSKLATKRGYYNFLAAERIGKHYSFSDSSSPFMTAAIVELAAHSGIIRTRELLVQKEIHFARREWYGATSKLDRQGMLVAAQLAYQWGWYEQSIRMAARSKLFDELKLRFATPHQQWVDYYSSQHQLDSNWAQAIMRRESAYAADARSSVGARGLMQLMPKTAQYVAKKQGWQWSGLKALNQPHVNIQYGVAYLAELHQQFSSSLPLATAAYNAGPHRVKRWLPKKKALPIDAWVETIPYRETRRYVRAVSEYMSIFAMWQANRQRHNSKTKKTAKPLMYSKQSVAHDLLQ